MRERGPNHPDVREIPPARRHGLIFETFEALKSGDAFIFVNDHDPEPLYYQFQAERIGQFSWDCSEQSSASPPPSTQPG